jgi:3-oxoacyl-[acyl-carrier-protein] synthase II
MTHSNAPPPDSSSAFTRNPQRRVVVTGLGVINPVGSTPEAFWASLAGGKSGVRSIQLFDASKLPVRIAGEVPDFNSKQYVEKDQRKSLRVMARSIQLAVAGAQLALKDSGIDKNQIDPTRFGVEFGSGLIATELEELAGAARVSGNCRPGQVDLEKWGDEGLANIPPLWMLKYLPNMLACHVSILHNAQGPNNTITEGDVAGALAIGESFRILQRNHADFFLVGGADSKINPLSMVRQCLFGRLSQRNDQPEKASRPFDKSRDGLVVAEGSGVIALEDLQHAQKRNARIYAELLGFGAAFDARRNGDGLGRAIQSALNEAGIQPEDLDHVNAHGISSVAQDLWEARGLHKGLGAAVGKVSVFAAKSYFGSSGAGSGPSELIASLLAQHHNTLPATLNFENPDPECPVNVNRECRAMRSPYFLKLSFTDMGQCAALVFRKWE